MMNAHGEYDVAVEEIHHVHKLDAPSGTGLTIANDILKNIKRKKNWVNKNAGAADELTLISKREGEIPGTHIVDYSSEVDRIRIEHTAYSRKGFASGAVRAAEFMNGKKGIFGMNDLLKM